LLTRTILIIIMVMIVCLCHDISERDIARQAASGCRSFADLQEETQVGLGCGACVPCAKETFAEHKAICRRGAGSPQLSKNPIFTPAS
jgi:bacterioferritin-associated ferredoxin